MLFSPSEFRWIELVNFSSRPQVWGSWTTYEVKTNPEVDTATPSNPVLYASAVKTGLAVLEKEGSKAAAAREIYTLLKDEHRDVILRAFMEGATCTPKGAPTYLYNTIRKFRRAAKADPVQE